MSDNYVGNVLSILRLVKTGDLNATSLGHIKLWIGDGASQSQATRICGYILDQVSGAESLIKGSQLSQEAKEGLLQTTAALLSAFSLDGINTTLRSHFPALDAAIANFAILASATGMSQGNAPSELAELISEIEEMSVKFDDLELDPIIRDTAKRHISVLATLLRNVESFGVDAAMAAYVELIIRLKRATGAASQSAAEKVTKLWPEIERWAGRLAIIEKAYNSSESLLSHFTAIPTLLQHLPNLPGLS